MGSIILIRPECSFREGIMGANKLTTKRRFFDALNKEESLVLGIMACGKLAYSKLKTSERSRIADEILANSHGGAALGLASVLTLIKSYANGLIVEVNQICYGGILRTIALGFTEGISSWKVEALCTFKPLVVPVGRSTLGRLFNVLGATIDAYVGIDELPIYSDYKLSFDQCEAKHTTHELQRVQYCRTEEEAKIMKISASQIKLTEVQFTKYLQTYIIKYLNEDSPQTKHKLERLGFVSILGIGSEIIDIERPEVMSFSNVAAEVAESKVRSVILEYIKESINKPKASHVNLEHVVKSMEASGIKGSVARDRNLSAIHKAPVSIQSLSVSLDLFETGIKVVDLLTPYKKEGKINLFRGAGVGKTVVIMELI